MRGVERRRQGARRRSLVVRLVEVDEDSVLGAGREHVGAVGGDHARALGIDRAQLEVLVRAQLRVQRRGHPAHLPLVVDAVERHRGVVAELAVLGQVPRHVVIRRRGGAVELHIGYLRIDAFGLQAIPARLERVRGGARVVTEIARAVKVLGGPVAQKLLDHRLRRGRLGRAGGEARRSERGRDK